MALSGMTGFARREGALGDWTWAVEARSVNGRNLEARFRAPPGLEGLDKVVRDGAAARFQRGQININLQARKAEGAAQARVNLDQLDRYLEVATRYAADGRVAMPSIEGLMSLRGVVETTEEVETPEARAALEAAIAVTLGEALAALAGARGEEGAALTPVLQGVVSRIEALVASAEGEAAAQPATLRERFEKRLAELAGPAGVDPDRIVQEAAVMAVKADVREELDRLKTHVDAARTLMAADGPSGRRLDFLSQEFMREANTMCSKSATSALTTIGLELKAAIEQFREQVQNVE